MTDSQVSLKLLIDTKSNKVLFAESSKEFVDFLFHILSLPVATVIKLLNKQGMIGSLANLYESIENLNETYIQEGQRKRVLLNPVRPSSAPSVPLLKFHSPTNQYYVCSNCCSGTSSYSRSYYIGDDPSAMCPGCKSAITSKATYVAPAKAHQASKEGGFVKGVVTYMIMDNLVVKPMSTISCIALLNKFNISDLSSLLEKEVYLGKNEAVKLLGACLHSEEVLTEVFLKNSKPNESIYVAQEEDDDFSNLGL